MFDLTGKVAVVTGGNGGIGLGFAEGLAEHGAGVCIWGTNEDKNAAAKETLAAYGGQVEALRCDVSNEAEVVAAFAKTVDAFGHVDSCFANAGVGGGGRQFDAMTFDEWDRVFKVNMDGVMFTFREAVKHMKETRRGGSLVVTSSGTARLRRGRQRTLLGHQGRGDRLDPVFGGRPSPLRYSCQRDRPRVDRNRHDRARASRLRHSRHAS